MIPIKSQELSKYDDVICLIKEKKFDSAQNLLDTYRINNFYNPDLIYLQSEIWFEIGESLNKNKNYIKAKYYYEKVLTLWPNRVELIEKIGEMDQKLLTIEKKRNLKFKITKESPKEIKKGFTIFIDESLTNGSVKVHDSNGIAEKKFQMRAYGITHISLSDTSDKGWFLVKPKVIFYFILFLFGETVLTCYVLFRRKINL